MYSCFYKMQNTKCKCTFSLQETKLCWRVFFFWFSLFYSIFCCIIGECSKTISILMCYKRSTKSNFALVLNVTVTRRKLCNYCISKMVQKLSLTAAVLIFFCKWGDFPYNKINHLNMSLLLFLLMAEFLSVIAVLEQLMLHSSVTKSTQTSCCFSGIWRHLLIK